MHVFGEMSPAVKITYGVTLELLEEDDCIEAVKRVLLNCLREVWKLFENSDLSRFCFFTWAQQKNA